MSLTRPLLVGAGIGAGFMYLFDPVDGRRRRALVRDQLHHALAKTDDLASATARDMRNRARGLVAEARRLVVTDEPSGDVLAERVREKLGHYVSHRRSIDVEAHDGCVTLRGPVLAHEVPALLRGVSSVRGVREVDNRLEPHETPAGVPGLQGGAERTGERSELFQRNWSPTARVFIGGAGVGLVSMAIVSRGRRAFADVLAVLGAAMVSRAVANRGLGTVFDASVPRSEVLGQRAAETIAPRRDAGHAARRTS
jgi:hypothetical protein